MKDVGKFYGHCVYFTAIWYILHMFIWYILWPFWYIFPFWYGVTRKIWQPCTKRQRATSTRMRPMWKKIAPPTYTQVNKLLPPNRSYCCKTGCCPTYVHTYVTWDGFLSLSCALIFAPFPCMKFCSPVWNSFCSHRKNWIWILWVQEYSPWC
jgi:hypothetical protein